MKLIVDGLFLTGSLKRLGELSEQRGDRQPIVSDVPGRIARLQRNEGR